MKNQTIIWLIAMLCPFSLLRAQDSLATEAVNTDRNIIKFSPFHLQTHTLYLSYERMLGNGRHSLSFSTGLTYRRFPDSNVLMKGTEEEVQYRYYFLPPAPDKRRFSFKGLYGGIHLSHTFRQYTQPQANEPKAFLNAVAGGLGLGYRLGFGKRFYLDLFLGGGYQQSLPTGYTAAYRGESYNGRSGFFPKSGFQLGFSF